MMPKAVDTTHSPMLPLRTAETLISSALCSPIAATAYSVPYVAIKIVDAADQQCVDKS
jgi:hypothetical protein